MSDPKAKPGIQPTPESVTSKGRSSRTLWIFLGAVAILFVVIVSLSLSKPHSTAAPSEPSEYDQTWRKSYSETTCDDWNNEMTDKQKFAASADILSAARDKIDGATGVAPDDLIDEFQSGITNVCVVPTMTLTDATYGLYSSEPRFHP